MVNELHHLAANAYEYRVLPVSKHGAEGAYMGYEIPSGMSSNRNGFYNVKVLHADTIQFQAVLRDDSKTTISVRIGPDGRPIAGSWIYTGEFE